MKKLLCGTLLSLGLLSCTAVPVGNKGMEVRDVGFQPHDIAKAGDIAVSIGNITIESPSLLWKAIQYAAGKIYRGFNN